MSFTAAAAIAFGSLGCGGDAQVDVPKFQDGQGQNEQSSVEYAKGPYGINQGSVVANYQFVGYADSRNPNGQGKNGLQQVGLADFYNPHAGDDSYVPGPDGDDRLYPAGSVYGEGTPKPTALLIDVSSVWCPPCNEEADTLLPPQFEALHPKGGQFLLNLADGPAPGTAATIKDLNSWTTQYIEKFPAVIDPEYKLAALFSADFFPANMLVNTRNMKICAVVSGAPDQAHWLMFQSIMAGTSPDQSHKIACLDGK